MIRKLKAAWRLLRSEGYFLLTLQDKEGNCFYDHDISDEQVLFYNGYLNEVYRCNMDALRQAKELLK